MTNTNIYFTEERKGYDKKQVDSYIKKLSEAYQTTFDEYKEINDKYENLLVDCNQQNENDNKQESTELNSEIITKALLNAEKLAQSITVDARAEAAAVKSEAQKIVDSAKNEASTAKKAAQRIINEANAEAIMIKEAAKKIMRDANAEAEVIVIMARKNLEQAHKAMEQATKEVEKLMKFSALDLDPTAAV